MMITETFPTFSGQTTLYIFYFLLATAYINATFGGILGISDSPHTYYIIFFNFAKILRIIQE